MILLQAASSQNFSFLFLMAGMFLVMYFFMIRPQQKKQKEQQKMIETLKEGDEVITSSGLHAKVLKTEDDTIILSAGGGARLTFDKSSIVRKK